MNKYIVGGTFDSNGGKASYIVNEMAKNLQNYKVINGGYINDLYKFRPHNIDILIWMPNVDNSEDKILPRLKVMNPKMLLVSSKRVIEKFYNDFDLVIKMIKSKSNLCIVIKRANDYYSYRILDPLGNVVSCELTDLSLIIQKLKNRINQLIKVERVSTQQVEFDIFPDSKPVSDSFLNIVQHFGTKFSEVIKAQNPERFLGNASTRCEYGFPSERRNDHILVSKRNVNKENITKYDFVKTYKTVKGIFYVGENKPSVDAPIQLALYEIYPNINYIIHGHCYIEGADFTKNKLPCGDLNELGEIYTVGEKHINFKVLNLLSHGCLIMCNDLKDFSGINLLPRPFPEY